MDQLIRGALELDLPAVRRGGRRGDEEELAGVGEVKVLVARLDGRGLAEVDLDGDAHDLLAVEDVADARGRLVVHEGDDDAAEGLEGRPDVDGRRGVDQVADDLQVVRAEDLGVFEVGDEQRVGGLRGRRDGREGGEVDGHGGRS